MFFFKYFFNKEKNNLRKISKGHRLLKDSNQLDYLDNLKIQLTNTSLKSKINSSQFIKIDSEVVSIEVAVRQFILQRFIGINFNKEVLLCLADKKKNFRYPLPLEWHNVISENGIKVNKFVCNFLWIIEMIRLWAYAFFEVVRQSINSFKLFYKSDTQKNETFVYFDSLGESNIPVVSGTYEYGILSWYLKYFDSHGIDYLAHTVLSRKDFVLNDKIKVKSVPSPILPPLTFTSLALFLGYSFFRLIISFFLLISGKWYNVLLLRDSFISKIINLNKGRGIAVQYLFHNSNWIYRPLWTYTAEKYNSEILFYFYSTNIIKFKKQNKQNLIVNGWNLVSWPNYLLWDKFQSDFIRQVSNYSYLEKIVGPISFVYSDIKEINLPENSIAIFDVQPVRTTYYDSLGLDQDYYVPEVANIFLSEVFEAVSSLNLNIAFKRKRNIGKLTHFKYSNKLNSISEEYKFLNIDPASPAELIINNAKAVISMPFTSTALVGKHLGKPSIFYDPSGLVFKDDPAAHGIMIINNKADLVEWLSKL
jgi:polysaccharide biosynthesis PFTS motif protein